MSFTLPAHLDRRMMVEAFSFAAQLHDAANQHDVAQIALTTFAALLSAKRWTLARVTGALQEAQGASHREAVKFDVLATRDTQVKSHAAIAPNDGEQSEVPKSDAESLSDAEHRFALEAAISGRAGSHTEASENLIVVPLTCHNRVIAVLCATRDLSSGATPFTDADIDFLRALAMPLALALNNAVRIAEAERLSRTDDLTNLHNARYMRDYLIAEIKRARRYNSNVAVLFLDLDNFKNVNDSHGHLVGSHVLIEVAKAILASVRDTDIVARYGGDEFVVVLPETVADRALQVAERIRATLAKTLFTGGRGLQLSLTASFGVAAYPAHANSAQQLVAAADRAMYEAKGARKNCVRPAHFERFEFEEVEFSDENIASQANG